jgi:hypothetical protein
MSAFHRFTQTAKEFNRSAFKPSAPGLAVFNAESIQKLDTLAKEIEHSSGSGRI